MSEKDLKVLVLFFFSILKMLLPTDFPSIVKRERVAESFPAGKGTLDTRWPVRTRI